MSGEKLFRVAAIFFASCGSILTAEAGEAPKAVETIKPGIFKPHEGRNVCQGVEGYSSAPGSMRTFLWRPEWLTAEKRDVEGDPSRQKMLREAAEKALSHKAYTVTAKLKTPASGNKHDYYSIGPYWWPTPGKRNGEPYSRKDGKVNPERDGEEFDRARLRNFSNDVRALALGYYYLGDRRYAEHAAVMLRSWFLNPETRMNPNLNSGQAVPGLSLGRAEGVIDMIDMVPVVESIGVIGPAKVLSAEEQAGLENWFEDMVGWMATSPIGRAERAKQNNHGIHYDYFMTQFSLFARLPEVTEHIVNAFPAKRLALQIAPDGSLPEELSRTRSWHYSFFALNAATGLAGMAECIGKDIWNFQTDDGRGLTMAFAYLAPYQTNMRSWPHKEIAFDDPAKEEGARRIAMETTRMMAWGKNDYELERLAEQHKVSRKANDDFWLSPLPKR